MDNVTEDGFWIVSPVAGGGYPWAQIFDRETLMIRPHFQESALPTSLKEVPLKQFDVNISPNPFWENLSFESNMEEPDIEITPSNRTKENRDDQENIPPGDEIQNMVKNAVARALNDYEINLNNQS